MKKNNVKIMLLGWLLLFLGQPSPLFADYTMMCTFSSNPEARVFKVSDEGAITFDYNLRLTEVHEPMQIEFAPNGRWGLVGYDSGSTPETQLATILKIDENYQISVLGSVHNEYYSLVAISPDSKYGVFGQNLQTLRYYTDNTYDVVPTENSYLAGLYADFSSLSGNLMANAGWPGEKISEFKILPDGRITGTGVVVDISPSSGFQGLKVSPDGRTCIVINTGDYRITSLRINELGGFSIAQQFNSVSANVSDIGFTPDSRYVFISFIDPEDGNIRSYAINPDSTLTLVQALSLGNDCGEDMAVTPDGKFAITRHLYFSRSYFNVVRINHDGTMEYLPENDYMDINPVSDMEFVPPIITSSRDLWMNYE